MNISKKLKKKLEIILKENIWEFWQEEKSKVYTFDFNNDDDKYLSMRDSDMPSLIKRVYEYLLMNDLIVLTK